MVDDWLSITVGSWPATVREKNVAFSFLVDPNTPTSGGSSARPAAMRREIAHWTPRIPPRPPAVACWPDTMLTNVRRPLASSADSSNANSDDDRIKPKLRVAPTRSWDSGAHARVTPLRYSADVLILRAFSRSVNVLPSLALALRFVSTDSELGTVMDNANTESERSERATTTAGGTVSNAVCAAGVSTRPFGVCVRRKPGSRTREPRTGWR